MDFGPVQILSTSTICMLWLLWNLDYSRLTWQQLWWRLFLTSAQCHVRAKKCTSYWVWYVNVQTQGYNSKGTIFIFRLKAFSVFPQNRILVRVQTPLRQHFDNNETLNLSHTLRVGTDDDSLRILTQRETLGKNKETSDIKEERKKENQLSLVLMIFKYRHYISR